MWISKHLEMELDLVFCGVAYGNNRLSGVLCTRTCECIPAQMVGHAIRADICGVRDQFNLPILSTHARPDWEEQGIEIWRVETKAPLFVWWCGSGEDGGDQGRDNELAIFGPLSNGDKQEGIYETP